MVARKGYKLTEVGEIPEDWEIHPIESLCSITTGSRNTQDSVDDGAYPFFVRSQTVEKINSYSFDGEAVLTAGDGVGTGKIFHYINGKCDVHQRVYLMSHFSDNLLGYYFFLHFSTNFYDRVMKMTAKSSVDSVRREMIARMPIPVPSIVEQIAIATALSDADALIDALEQSIAKKRQIKKGAMQELLTGKRRLPGFAGEWSVKQLGDVGQIKSGGTPSTLRADFWDGEIPWCTPSDLTNLTCSRLLTQTSRSISQYGLKFSSAEIIPKRSLIMTTRATIGECAINSVPMTTNQGFKNIVPFADVNVDFLYYLMSTQKNRLVSLCGGSTFLEMGKTQLLSFEILMPDYNEQTAIANILSDMDDEIAALEAKLAKARQIKIGMMQELLTGRIRLV